MVVAYNTAGFILGGVALVVLFARNEFDKWHRRKD